MPSKPTWVTPLRQPKPPAPSVKEQLRMVGKYIAISAVGVGILFGAMLAVGSDRDATYERWPSECYVAGSLPDAIQWEDSGADRTAVKGPDGYYDSYCTYKHTG